MVLDLRSPVYIRAKPGWGQSRWNERQRGAPLVLLSPSGPEVRGSMVVQGRATSFCLLGTPDLCRKTFGKIRS